MNLKNGNIYKMIGIRADGNSQIGMGHLMRCITIARAVEETGNKVVFFTASKESAEVIALYGFGCEVLNTDYRDMESELNILTEYLAYHKVAVLLIDSYQVTDSYLEYFNSLCPVFYMDDECKRVYPVSGIINYNIYAHQLGYSKIYPSNVILLLGEQYIPVRKEFGETIYHLKQDMSNILITVGGSDSLNIAGKIVEAIQCRNIQDVFLTVVCGKFNPHLDMLRDLEKRNPSLKILVDVKNMWEIMASSDLAISAAGSTIYELCAVGVPTICFYYVENQRKIAEAIASCTEISNMGDYSADPNGVVSRIVDELIVLINDDKKRISIHESVKQISDGLGAERIVKQFVKAIDTLPEKRD